MTSESSNTVSGNSSTPPVAPRRPHRFAHHGISVEDPYFWLKDQGYPNVDDVDVLDYLRAENAYFESAMAPLAPLVEEIFSELKNRRPAADSSVPWFKDGFWHQWRFEEGAQYRVWLRQPGEQYDPPKEEAWEVLLDENILAEGREYFRLGALSISPDSKKLAYSTDTDGGERFTMHIVEITSSISLTEPIENTLGSPEWSSDSSSIAYVIVSEQWRPFQVYRRNLADQPRVGADALIYEETDTGYFVGIDTSSSDEYLLISTGDHTSSEVRYVPAADLSAAPQLIATRRPNHEYSVDHGRQGFVIRSNARQPNFDIYTTSPEQPEEAHWQLHTEGGPDRYITGFLLFDSYLVTAEKIQGLDQVYIQTEDEGHYIEFPEAAYDLSFGTNPNFVSNTLRLGYTSMVTPSTVFDYDISERTLTTLKIQKIPSGYNAEDFVTTRLLAPTRDGVKVPVSIVHHRSTPIDGSAPTYLYGYGAYGSATPPAFSPSRVSLLERGFIFAIAHIRGGDDLGYTWYTDGKLDKRTNTFNDFVDVARHLIDEKYARAGHIAIAGGSAGGELMGAVVNQAPELWGAVAAHVPFVDVLNTMLDESLPLTPMEWPEWGNPIEDKEAFIYIQSYSPYDQLVARDYPPMMVTAGLNDPRVTYWEPAKYVAKLRHLKTDNNRLIFKTNMGAGHGGQSGRFDSLKELAEEYAFIIDQLENPR
ncbi:MAG: S9 family peptidase [Pseudomonadota bacterium]